MKNLSPRVKGVIWFLALTGVVFLAVQALRWSVSQVSWERERKWAKQIEPLIGSSACESPRLAQKLVSHLYPLNDVERARPIRVRVLDEGTVNAFASLGGEIFVYRGLLQKVSSPEALAGILAHEMEHSARRHVLSALSEQGVSLILLAMLGDLRGSAGVQIFHRMTDLSYGRAREREADAAAYQRLTQAGVPVAAWIGFFEQLLKEQGDLPEWISDHPSLQARIEKLRELEKSAPKVTAPRALMSERDWRKLQQSPCR